MPLPGAKEMVKRKYTGKIIQTLTGIWAENRLFINSLGRDTRRTLLFVFGFHFLILLIFLVYIPFHYDEAWSYTYFSSKGIWQTMHFYPQPNNHIFYNLVAYFFLWLPLPVELSTRLPSLIAHFIALYYFFKLSSRYFSAGLSIGITLLLAVSYPILMYAIEARGYSFIICSTVLMLYAAEGLVREPGCKKLRFLFFGALIAGLYSLPSFLYAALPLDAALFFAYLVQKSKKDTGRFVLDNLKTLGVVFLLYFPVMHDNDIHRLIQPNGVLSSTLAYTVRMMPAYFLNEWHYLTGFTVIPFYLLIPPVAAVFYAGLKNRNHGRFLAFTTLFLLFSAPLILVTHRVFPFERTWIYLSIPLTLAIGFLIDLGNLSSLLPAKLRPLALWMICAALMIGSYTHFKTAHARQFALDYNIRDCFKKIGPAIGKIRKISYTDHALEFYAAEDLFFQCYKRNPGQNPQMEHPAQDSTADVLVLAPGSGDEFPPHGFYLVDSFPKAYSLYLHQPQ